MNETGLVALQLAEIVDAVVIFGICTFISIAAAITAKKLL
tara:strand:- start:883 stop:1002 length:120 start_codon:yes stop_codon:yes gene_type:complete